MDECPCLEALKVRLRDRDKDCPNNIYIREYCSASTAVLKLTRKGHLWWRRHRSRRPRGRHRSFNLC